METPENFSAQSPLELESLQSVCKRIDMGKSWVYERMKTDPTFPKPVTIGGRKRFVVQKVTDWINAQIDASRDD